MASPIRVMVRLGVMTSTAAANSTSRSQVLSRASAKPVKAIARITMPTAQPMVVSKNSPQVKPLVTISIAGE